MRSFKNYEGEPVWPGFAVCRKRDGAALVVEFSQWAR